MIDPLDLARIVRALRRSRARRAALRALVELGVAASPELAVRARVGRADVEGALVGRMPRYRPLLSLASLGLARACPTPEGVVFAATDKARELAPLLSGRELP